MYVYLAMVFMFLFVDVNFDLAERCFVKEKGCNSTETLCIALSSKSGTSQTSFYEKKVRLLMLHDII